MKYPKVFLAVNNCFASKRWTRPRDWMNLVRDLGLWCVEASADTEADPLYSGDEYMSDWVQEVAYCEKSIGVKVVNLYSGHHGTYATFGLGYTDSRVRQRMLELWVKPMARTAAQICAGLGFYCHAFPDAVLQDPDEYTRAVGQLYELLSQIAVFVSKEGTGPVGVEQMYSPHQIPWTIDGARKLLVEVFRRSGVPFYVTLDTGHQTGQHKFLRPDPPTVLERACVVSSHDSGSSLWLGPTTANDRFEKCRNNEGRISDHDMSFILREMYRFPFLFSRPEDADTYAWLASLGCYSPIIHLQQVTGDFSAHLPFTPQINSRGAVHADKVLQALLRSYLQPICPGFPEKCKTIYLTLEIIFGAAETPSEIMSKLRESVCYWRRYVPEDGTPLDELVEDMSSAC